MHMKVKLLVNPGRKDVRFAALIAALPPGVFATLKEGETVEVDEAFGEALVAAGVGAVEKPVMGEVKAKAHTMKETK